MTANMDAVPGPKLNHLYNPWDGDTITYPDGFVEQIINQDTNWYPLCDPNSPLTNTEYNNLTFDNEQEDCCSTCLTKLKEEEKWGL